MLLSESYQYLISENYRLSQYWIIYSNGQLKVPPALRQFFHQLNEVDFVNFRQNGGKAKQQTCKFNHMEHYKSSKSWRAPHYWATPTTRLQPRPNTQHPPGLKKMSWMWEPHTTTELHSLVDPMQAALPPLLQRSLRSAWQRRLWRTRLASLGHTPLENSKGISEQQRQWWAA